MYIPSSFRVDDVGRIHELVNEHPFGMLISNASPTPEVTHLPMLIQANPSGDSIFGHLARVNPHAQMLLDGKPARAVFSGPHGYITPRWYVTPNSVPTWNYLAVHAVGKIRRIEDHEALIKLVDDLVAVHEDGATEPWRANWGHRKLTGMLGAIVGFELVVEHWEAKAKLGQNRSAEDQASMAKHLEASEHAMHRQLAAERKKEKP